MHEHFLENNELYEVGWIPKMSREHMRHQVAHRHNLRRAYDNFNIRGLAERQGPEDDRPPSQPRLRRA